MTGGSKVILLACGSFNPPTNMHLRMFELARDHLQRLGTQVIGGLMSPVHDGYGKADLVSATHRLKLLELALQNSDWIKVSDWETTQESWQRTRASIQYHQNKMNSLLSAKNGNDNDEWFIDDSNGPVQVKLLCGGDLLESFATPGLWSNDDIESIVGRHGLVVISRENTNPQKFIYNSDILTKHMGNITIVTEWIKNEVSSTKIRRALRRSESVKYLLPDNVIDYIKINGLYGAKISKNEYLTIPLRSFTNSNNDSLNLSNTPSPLDISMGSPSPTRLPCMNICNNNSLFLRQSIDVPDVANVKNKNATNATAVNNANLTSSVKNATTVKQHPGQAVKVIASRGGGIGQKVIVLQKEVRESSNEKTAAAASKLLKSSKSCAEFDKFGGKLSLTASKSNDSLDCKSCDENLIKFIFTKHGIQVISDVETIV